MVNIVKVAGNVYVPGRAGELTHVANAPTFALLEKIFGHKGPYRNVLLKFGIGDRHCSKSFLKLINGKVLTSIESENKALWESCMYKLVLGGEKVELKLNLTVHGILKGLLGFIKKNIKEIFILTNLERSVRVADEKYRVYCDIAHKTIEKQSITTKEFLMAYEDVAYVTYLFELLFNYNQGQNYSSAVLDNYVRENDYLLKYDESFAELIYKPKNGFSVESYGSKKNTKKIPELKNLNLIPCRIPNAPGDGPLKFKAEKSYSV